jgi:arginine:pyruvate transaminase
MVIAGHGRPDGGRVQLSKSHALPAFRLGWMVGPPELINLQPAAVLTYGSPAFIQDGALAALREDLPEVAALREDYRTRAAMMSSCWPRRGCIRSRRKAHVRLARCARHRRRRRFRRRLLDGDGSRYCPATGSALAPQGIALALGGRLRNAALHLHFAGLNPPRRERRQPSGAASRRRSLEARRVGMASARCLYCRNRCRRSP